MRLARNRANSLVCLHFCNSTFLLIRLLTRTKFALLKQLFSRLWLAKSAKFAVLPQPPTAKEVVNKHRNRARILDNRIWMLFVNW